MRHTHSSPSPSAKVREPVRRLLLQYTPFTFTADLENPVLGSMIPGTVRLLQAYPSLSSQASVNGVRRPSTPVGPRMTLFSPLRLMSSNGVFRSAVLDHAVRAPLDEARAGAYTGPARQTILGHQAAGHRRLSWPPTVRGGLAGHEDGGQEPDLAFRRLWRPERLPPPAPERPQVPIRASARMGTQETNRFERIACVRWLRAARKAGPKQAI